MEERRSEELVGSEGLERKKQNISRDLDLLHPIRYLVASFYVDDLSY
jgi:hypothetical protein